MSKRTAPIVFLAGFAMIVAGTWACNKDEGMEGSGEESAEQAGSQGEEQGGTTEQTTTEGAGSAEQADAEDPEALGTAIDAVRVRCLADLRELLEGRPEVAAVRPQVEALKEQCIQELVVLGHRREALDEAARAQVDRVLQRVVFRADPADFEWYQEVINHYRSIDNDFANLVADFNIITQYAAFELLRSQEPEEAQRLGVAQ